MINPALHLSMVRLAQLSSPKMGLLGSYSNPEIQGRLRQLSEKLERLAASDAAPCPSGRQDRRLRGGLVPGAIERVLRKADGPMRARAYTPRSRGYSGGRCRSLRSRTGWPRKSRARILDWCGWIMGDTIGSPRALERAGQFAERQTELETCSNNRHPSRRLDLLAMPYRTVVTVRIASNHPLPAYGGVQHSDELLERLAQATRTGAIPMVVNHDHARPLNASCLAAEVVELPDGHRAVEGIYEVDSGAWDAFQEELRTEGAPGGMSFICNP
jgi:hypothetical protein